MYAATKLEKTVCVTDLMSLHYFAYVKRFRFEGESHPFWELIYCDSGEAYIHDEAEGYTLCPGELFLHAPDRFHDVRTGDVFTNVTVVGFGGELGPAAALAGRILKAGDGQKELLRAVLELGRRTFADPLNLVYQPALRPKEDAPAWGTERIGKCLEMLLLSLRGRPAETEESEKTDRNRNYHRELADRIAALLEENLSERVRLEDIARHFGYSVPYLKRVFSACKGCGIIAYFNRAKILRAKRLMCDSSLSVTQIAQQLGFDSLQYFSRQFRRYTNMSPSEYAVSLRLDGVMK